MSGPWVLGMMIVVAVAATRALVQAIWGPAARARRRLRHGPPELVDGEAVTLQGRVRASAPMLRGPLSDRACVVYRVRILVYEGVGTKRKCVCHVVEDRMTPFVLETALGEVLVDEGALELGIPPAPVIPRDLQREADLLRTRGVPARTLADATIEEVAIEPGSKIAVHGVAIVERDPAAAGYRDATLRARLVAQPNHPLTFGRAGGSRRRHA